MFKRKNDPDWDLKRLTDEELELLPLAELQRIINKRWSYNRIELLERAEAELSRRNPKNNWKCQRCNREHYHEKEIRVSGGFMQGFLGLETDKYHAVICNYCGKTEFYNVLMPSSEKAIGMLGN